MRCAHLIGALLVFLSLHAGAQSADRLSRYFEFEDKFPFSYLLTYFPPMFLQHDVQLKQFIRTKTFGEIRTRYGDARAADAIFVRAMNLTDNNTAMALLLSSLASFDHDIVGLKIPVFNMYLPLTSESRDDFERRIRHLPRRLFADTPADSTGDRDKLQHFFGSAFLAFTCESEGSADRVGNFIETGEEAMIVGGVNDPRDVRANRRGQQFGLALLEDNRRYPSEFIALPLAAREGGNGSAKCTGVR